MKLENRKASPAGCLGLILSLFGLGMLSVLVTEGPTFLLGQVNTHKGRASGKSSENNSRSTSDLTQKNADADKKREALTDPALQIQSSFSFYPDDRFPFLNSRLEYSKTVGDLARIQNRMLSSSVNVRNFPDILVGAGKFTGKCDVDGPVLGTYFSKPGCQAIQINFEAGGLIYEKPIEVITVLAHEYAHHLTEITIGLQNISGLEAELIADCFAGVVHGYWDKHGKITEEDIRSAVTMMIQVSKQEQLNTSDMHGDPGQRIGAFLAGAIKASGNDTHQFQNFCKGLERVIDFSKGLP